MIKMLRKLLAAGVMSVSVLVSGVQAQIGPDDPGFDEQLFYHRAFEVALWALPATDSFATREAIERDLGGKANDVVINTRPMNSDIHLVALQTQTPYLQGAIDVRDGPMVVEVPPATERAHMYGTIVDAWQRPLEERDIGVDGWDDGKGAKYLILPPGYDGDIPDGYNVMHSRTYLQNFLIRSISSAGWDTAVEYAYKLRIYPLSEADNPGETRFLDMSQSVYRAAPEFDDGYFDLINQLIQEEPANPYDRNMLGMAAYIGIQKDKLFEPDEKTREMFRRVASDVQRHIIRINNGSAWVPVETQPGWSRFNLLPGDVQPGKLYVYENEHGMIDYQRRATIDYWAYAMPAVLGSGTMYNVAFVDADDNPIDPSKTYRIRMPADFPARSFWSVFGYDQATRTFIANGDKGRHLSSNDDLVKNADGSVYIYVGPTVPEGYEANWIETIPGSGVFIGLRTYGPEPEVLDGRYTIPRFELFQE